MIEAKSDRLYLRELTHADVTDEYLSWFKENDVTKFLESKNLIKQDVVEYIALGKNTGRYFIYAICDISNNKHIGNLKIGPIDRRHMVSDLVVVIGDTDYWGKGMATEIIIVGNQLAFDKHNIRKLSGGIYKDNIGSIKCYTRAGWIIEGTLKDHYLTDDGKTMDKILVSCFNSEYKG